MSPENKVDHIIGLVKAFNSLCQLWEVEDKDMLVAARVFCFTVEECQNNNRYDALVVAKAAHQMIKDAYAG